MKRLCLYLIVAVYSLQSVAQAFPLSGAKRKTGLFRQLPDSISVDVPSLEALLRISAGSEISIELSRFETFPIQGIVLSTTEKYNGKIHSVSLRSSAYEGAIFHVSRSLLDNGQAVFRGTWMHKDYDELYVLSGNGNEYALIKKRFEEVFME